MTKTLIAVPSMDYVAAGFAASLAMLRKTGDTLVSFICGSLIYDARNKLGAQAIKLEADQVLWLDSDMTFEPDTLTRLMQTMKDKDADIVSGLYFRRSAPYTPVAFSKVSIDPETNASTHQDYTGPLEGVHEVEGIGFGCVLMKTDVLFDVFGKYGGGFDPVGHFGEDLSFCWRARELGYKIMLDTGVKCGHIGHMTVTQSFYQAWTEGHKNES
jgi:GT2 family glycosyltransferase